MSWQTPGHIILGGILACTAADAMTIYVDAHGSDCSHADGSQAKPFCDLQQGIDAAIDGDVVLVAPGNYVAVLPFDLEGKAITVISSAGPDVTTLSGTADSSTVVFHTSESRACVLEGFTIGEGADATVLTASILCNGSSPTIRGNVVQGSAPSDGGCGIRCESGASPLIVDNVIQDHLVRSIVLGPTAEGGGISSHESSPEIVGNVIARNTVLASCITGGCAGGNGGGIYTGGGASSIRANVITDNEARSGGGIWVAYGLAEIVGNTIVGNRFLGVEGLASGFGGGIGIGQGAPVIDNNLIARNASPPSFPFVCAGGGIALLAADPSTRMTNNTLFDNVANIAGGGIYADNSVACLIESTILWGDRARIDAEVSGTPTLAHCDVQGGFPGDGNLDSDPLFADPANDDFSLRATSPCIDAGDPADMDCGVDGKGNPRRLDGHLAGTWRVDIGCYEFDHVRLDVTGQPSPGGTITIDTTGTAGLPVALFVGTAPGDVCVFPYGPLFFDVTSPWRIFPWGHVPSTVSISIPSDVAVPQLVVLQEICYRGAQGNVSNAVEMTIQ
jgi:hypothetical protein